MQSSGEPMRKLILSPRLMHLANAGELSPLECFTHSQAVCFDVDSTVIVNESIDELANAANVGSDVAVITRRAMMGEVSYEDSLRQRLELIKPSRSFIDNFNHDHEIKYSPCVVELINLLHRKGRHVYLVTGGFRQTIEPIAKDLSIPSHHLFANTLLFDAAGEYAGFDDSEPTSKDFGKSSVVEMIKSVYGYALVTMIGDGITDAQARPPADAFIGYGGNVVRENTKAMADLYIDDFKILLDALNGQE